MAHGGYETAEVRDVRRNGEGRGLRGGPVKRVWTGCFLDDLRAFGINADQWTTAAQGKREWCRTTEHFMAKWIAAEKAGAGLRHAVVCPNVTRRTKERIAQSKRARAGSLATEHPDFELEGSARSNVQFKGELPEATPCVAYAPVDLDGQVGIVVDVPPEVYKLVRLIVHLAHCLYAEYGGGLRHPLRALTHDLSLGLRYGEAKRRAHDHDHPHHLPQLLG